MTTNNNMKHFSFLTMVRILLSLCILGCTCTQAINATATTTEEANDVEDVEFGSALDPHPDPNDENYDGMIYIGRHDEEGHRVGFEVDNGELFYYYVFHM
jgi:hypothetical protein